MKLVVWAFSASLVAAGVAANHAAHAATPPPESPLVLSVRAANARFADVKVALAEGYSPIPCTSGADGGAMGVHYVNPTYLEDAVPAVGRPQAVMYEPKPGGGMELVAVEYITFKGPASLDGHLFNFQGAPNRYGLNPFYQLHVWAWRKNPKGPFTDMNPAVSCDHASMHH